jgi:5-methylcytosine-specific restriction endonuclease McrA
MFIEIISFILSFLLPKSWISLIKRCGSYFNNYSFFNGLFGSCSKMLGGGFQPNNSYMPTTSTPVNYSRYGERPMEKEKRNVSNVVKKFVASNQQWKCALCSKTLDHTYEVDHIVPLGKGGNNNPENLQSLCVSCHKTKTMREFYL